jgi:hypothetical protein
LNLHYLESGRGPAPWDVARAATICPPLPMLSHAARPTGVGRAFGLHEAMDTIGAIVGPLAVAAALHFEQGSQTSLAMLLIPALLRFSGGVVRWRRPPPNYLRPFHACGLDPFTRSPAARIACSVHPDDEVRWVQ